MENSKTTVAGALGGFLGAVAYLAPEYAVYAVPLLGVTQLLMGFFAKDAK